MDGTRSQQDERGRQEARARWTMWTWQWARWPALILAVSWAASWIGSLSRGERGQDLWWPLASTVIWTAVTVNGFVTCRRIRTTTLPSLTRRPSA
ncbi:membrane protein [Streptomyces caelestis]|uniref:Membrane protein n=1 Tax=Streptomyces caelestis TaxID=36816 RepID=A0A0M8QKG1_9ACTN|nr:membrane protein [Streptomyces caelestis]